MVFFKKSKCANEWIGPALIYLTTKQPGHGQGLLFHDAKHQQSGGRGEWLAGPATARGAKLESDQQGLAAVSFSIGTRGLRIT